MAQDNDDCVVVEDSRRGKFKGRNAPDPALGRPRLPDRFPIRRTGIRGASGDSERPSSPVSKLKYPLVFVGRHVTSHMPQAHQVSPTAHTKARACLLSTKSMEKLAYS